jgi:hypothetical protein
MKPVLVPFGTDPDQWSTICKSVGAEADPAVAGERDGGGQFPPEVD